MNAGDYLDQLINLLPRGRAWSRDPASVLGRLLGAFADAAARFEARARQLLLEADPRTTTESIDAWENDLALPDSCAGASTDLAVRRAAAWRKLTATGGQSKAYYMEQALRLGFDITITEYRPIYCTGSCTGSLFTDAWRFTWLVTVTNAAEAPEMECIFRRDRQPDTAVIFEYEG